MRRRTFAQLATGCLVGIGGCAQFTENDTDQNGSQTQTATQSPTKTPVRYIDDFKGDLTQLDMSVQTLEYMRPIVSLEYKTNKSQYQQISDQIGRISGLFFKYVEEGWEATRLNAVVTVSNQAGLSWHARSKWYEAYAADEINGEELTLKILKTVSRED